MTTSSISTIILYPIKSTFRLSVQRTDAAHFQFQRHSNILSFLLDTCRRMAVNTNSERVTGNYQHGKYTTNYPTANLQFDAECFSSAAVRTEVNIDTSNILQCWEHHKLPPTSKQSIKLKLLGISQCLEYKSSLPEEAKYH